MRNYKQIVILVAFLVAVNSNLQAQEVSSNILQRVFLIKYGEAFGSSFTIDVDDKQYLVTARHIVKGIKDGDSIQLMHNGNWQSLQVKVIDVNAEEVDITVLALPRQLSPSLPIAATMGHVIVSQNMYFLGFPYGFQMEGTTLNNGFPLPFVKQGICSAFRILRPGVSILFLDGFNNPGFSGGPIVFVDRETRKLTIAGVVHGYQQNIDKVTRLGKSKKSKGGQIDTKEVVLTNSGILIGYGIDSAIEAIKRKPIGAIVSE